MSFRVLIVQVLVARYHVAVRYMAGITSAGPTASRLIDSRARPTQPALAQNATSTVNPTIGDPAAGLPEASGWYASSLASFDELTRSTRK